MSTRLRRYPLQPLIDALGLREVASPYPCAPPLTVEAQLARLMGVHQALTRRARRGGLSERAADRWAIAVGLHPDLVWADYMSDTKESHAIPA